MKIEELVVLLPCHSLEDFPTHHEGEEAEGLLGAWSALWHPKLIANCGKAPSWSRADAPPENLKRKLIVIPQISESLLLTGWPTRAKTEGAKIIRKTAKRADIVTAALAIASEPEPAGTAAPAVPTDAPPQLSEIPADLVADFLALGTCYLLVELLTRQMRYMSNLDEVHFQNEAVAGALAAAEGREDEARTHIRNAFDSLYEARERFYPVDNFFIDLTLTADTTLGPSMRRELDGDAPFNILITGKLLDLMAEKHPDTLVKLRHALDRGTGCIVGGEYDERESTLLGPEAVLADFRRGRASYEKSLGKAPDVYGRRKQGLSPLVPSITARHGFEGALGFTLDDGRFPASDSPKTRWEGLDTSAIDTLARTPLDANVASSFLDLPRKVGESMDRDFVSTIVFAHWPGTVSPYYEDLRRITNYVPVLGKFKTLSDYFQNTERPGTLNRYSPDKFRTTFLRQSIVRNLANPISWVGDAIKRRLTAESAATLHVMNDAIGLRPTTAKIPAADLLARVDEESVAGAPKESIAQLDEVVAASFAEATSELADTLTGRKKNAPAPAAGETSGVLVINTQLAARREVVDVASLATLPAVGGAVVAVQEVGEKRVAVVDVPAMGFAWVAAGPAVPKPRKPPKPLVDENVLRNDLIEVHISRKTGGLQGLFSNTIRGNRLSQQLAFRFPSPRQKPGDLWRDPDLEPIYSTMICDRFETSLSGPAMSSITTGGLLLDPEAKPIAKFSQRFTIVQGSPLVQVEIKLDITEQPRAEAWGSYYAARFAWPDESTSMGRGVFLTHQPTKAKQPESPTFLELETETTSTMIFPQGLPHHLLTGERMLDMLLIGKNETRREFSYTLGVEIDHPSAAALQLLEPCSQSIGQPRPTSGETGWLFHIDVKSVVATHWESLVDAGKVIGFRVRLLETEGLAGRVHLRTLRKLTSARQIDGREQTLVDLTPEADKLGFEIGAYEWLELEARY
jgi:alpha-mannosidase